MDSFPFPLVGIYIKNHKDTPNFDPKKLERGSCRFLGNQKGTLAALRKDCKDVFALTNYLFTDVTIVERKLKNSEEVEYHCPLMIATYNSVIGGVDLTNQNISVYDLDRWSNKWRKRLFHKLLSAAVINS